MYRVEKVLNHNAILALNDETQKSYLIMGKGIGFGKKTSERFEVRHDDILYSLEKTTERGNAMSIVKAVDPYCLEIAGHVLDKAEKVFGDGKVDRTIIFPMADHIAFAVNRLKDGQLISNPLRDDIRVLFHSEYKVAEAAAPMIRDHFGVELNSDEIGFLALHVHSAIDQENVAQSLQTAQIVRNCISRIEDLTGTKMSVMSLGYNRMMNHIRYMIPRIQTGEPLKMDLNDYMKVHYPDAYTIAEELCSEIGHTLHKNFQKAEIGYLAMHIQRVTGDEVNE
ncbi:MAG: PRD domain-containing protein [Lachnospiraceae bacterium]|nr:PRD domain-containing protein [Lachnospiraceae bacterium]